VSIQYDGDIIH
jgi:hypothetical protein